MALTFTSLASSSRYGNAYLVQSATRSVLIDCGVACRRLEKTCEALGIAPASLDAIFITHEHGDHTRALALKHPFSHRHELPVYAPIKFWDLWGARGWCCLHGQPIEPGQTMALGDVAITCFSKPHDTVAPVGYLVESAHHRLALLTDLGEIPPALIPWLRGCTHLILESNYDGELQHISGRTEQLIERITGPWGHLSNHQAGMALHQLVTATTRTILLAHLSLDCNTPELAYHSARQALRTTPFSGCLRVAPAARPSPWLG